MYWLDVVSKKIYCTYPCNKLLLVPVFVCNSSCFSHKKGTNWLLIFIKERFQDWGEPSITWKAVYVQLTSVPTSLYTENPPREFVLFSIKLILSTRWPEIKQSTYVIDISTWVLFWKSTLRNRTVDVRHRHFHLSPFLKIHPGKSRNRTVDVRHRHLRLGPFLKIHPSTLWLFTPPLVGHRNVSKGFPRVGYGLGLLG